MKLRLFLLAFILIIFHSCIYDYLPESFSANDKNLLVSALLTNELKPVEVVLSRMVNVNAHAFQRETEAEVAIVDDTGQITKLTEVKDGTYSTREPFCAEFGKRYKLTIVTQDRNQYESKFESLTKPQEINGLSYDFFKKVNTYQTDFDYGYQFYVNIDTKRYEKVLFRYELDETWEIRMKFRITLYWDGKKFVPINLMPQICWQHRDIAEYYLANSDIIGTNKINKFPLNYVNHLSDRLSFKYCLNVKQYTMSDSTYQFWKAQVDNLGRYGLYTKQPYQGISNIRNVNNPGEKVMGIFEVSGVTSKRIFTPDELWSSPRPYLACDPEPMPYPRNIPFYAIAMTITDGPNTYRDTFRISDPCADCETDGASPIKPDFWE
jgi:hypothetical protein